MRSFVNIKFSSKLEEMAKNNETLIKMAKEYILARIEFVNGHRAFVDLLIWNENEDHDIKTVKKLFLRFCKWFLRERAVR